MSDDALVVKAEFYSDWRQRRLWAQYQVALRKTAPLGLKIDIVFATVQIGLLFFADKELVARKLVQVKAMIDQGWDGK
jgi:hypothetical protein